MNTMLDLFSDIELTDVLGVLNVVFGIFRTLLGIDREV